MAARWAGCVAVPSGVLGHSSGRAALRADPVPRVPPHFWRDSCEVLHKAPGPSTEGMARRRRCARSGLPRGVPVTLAALSHIRIYFNSLLLHCSSTPDPDCRCAWTCVAVQASRGCWGASRDSKPSPQDLAIAAFGADKPADAHDPFGPAVDNDNAAERGDRICRSAGPSRQQGTKTRVIVCGVSRMAGTGETRRRCLDGQELAFLNGENTKVDGGTTARPGVVGTCTKTARSTRASTWRVASTAIASLQRRARRT